LKEKKEGMISKEYLEGLSRKELQVIAKDCNVKANLKSVSMIDAILSARGTEEEEEEVSTSVVVEEDGEGQAQERWVSLARDGRDLRCVPEFMLAQFKLTKILALGDD